MSSVTEVGIPAQTQKISGPTLGWVVKRALIGMTILSVAVATFAYLLYAGIEPDRAEAADPPAQIATQAKPSESVNTRP